MTEHGKMISLLPSHLQEDRNINIILRVFGQVLEEVQAIMLQVALIGDTDSTGNFLDETGKIVDEYRQGENDEDFRNRIVTKIIRMISKGNIETINGLGRSLLKENFIGILENWSVGDTNKSGNLTLIYDFTNVDKNPINLFKPSLAGGVGLDTKLQIYTPIFDMYEYGVTNLVQFPMLIDQ